MQYAILLDAGFVKRKLGTAKNQMDIQQIRDLIDALKHHPALKAHHLHRVYYYDAVPYLDTQTNPLTHKHYEFSKTSTVKRQNKLLTAVKNEPFFAVRLGELSFEGWQLKPQVLKSRQPRAVTTDDGKSYEISITDSDIVPRLSQKGVDMRIGMDMASLVLKRIAQILVLVTGDSDFVPAMKFARREGASVYIVPLGHHIKNLVREHCDLVLELPECTEADAQPH